MKGDFSRNTFYPHRHFSRVLLQQGRVQLDADWNEQVAILLHNIRSMIVDFAGPDVAIADGFKIVPSTDEDGNPLPEGFDILPGHFYLAGLLCENEEQISFTGQDDYPVDENPDPAKPVLVYLDAWERHITHLQVPVPLIREVALGGPDTATRAQVVWQVKTQELSAQPPPTCAAVRSTWDQLREGWQPRSRGRLKAEAELPEGADPTNPCLSSPEARYRGPENQLYRVEIHRGGPAGGANGASFKWSRENGSVVFPILSLAGNLAELEHLGPDPRFGLQVGDWVEILNDRYALRGEPGPLATVERIDPLDRTVELQMADNAPLHTGANPILRRWDYRQETEDGGEAADDGALLVEEGEWIALEDGVQIFFEQGEAGEIHRYRTGDYWQIPARTATEDVEWPAADGEAVALPPHGVEHHYAPLAVVLPGAAPAPGIEDCRKVQQP